MPSDTSRILTRLGINSTSSHKHSSKTHHKSGGKVIKNLDEDQYHDENSSLWQHIKITEGNSSTLIFAIVASDQQKPMKKLIQEKERKKSIRSSIVVTTQNRFQEAIANSSTAKKHFKTLHLLVSSTVSQLTYNIEDFVDRVFVKPCGSGAQQDALRIGSSSTYCGFKSYAWPLRDDARQLNKELTHHEGCVFDVSDDKEGALRLLKEPGRIDLSPGEQAEIMRNFKELKEVTVNEKAQPGSGAGVSANSSARPSTSTNGTELWFQKWKATLASIIAAGAGVAGMAGGFWISAGGIMVKGPCGLYMAAGYATTAAFGSVGVAGGTAAIAAYGAVYLIPWDRVWGLIQDKLWQIWEKVKEVIWETLVWIKDKLAQMASSVISMVSWSSQEVPNGIRMTM